MRRFAAFAARVTTAHVVTYFVAGALAYPLLTRPFYEGADAIFAPFMRTPAEPALWAHVTTWFAPAQIVRGLLMATALYPFFDTLAAWTVAKRGAALAALYLVFGFWASAVAAPGTIDGMVYLRPEITPFAHLMVQPEIIAQALLLGYGVAWWMAPRPARQRVPA